MERYHFFASSCKQFGLNSNSLAELRIDESETEGALATVLKVLQRIHSLFFGLVSDSAQHFNCNRIFIICRCTDQDLVFQEHEDNLESQDVRLVNFH